MFKAALIETDKKRDLKHKKLVANTIFQTDEGMADARTFGVDDSLPDLPLPELDATLQLYLESVRPHVGADELETTEELVRNFAEGVGADLHQQLKHRASEKKNWVKNEV